MLGQEEMVMDCIGHAVVATANISVNELTIQREFILH
jgi:hypothetical protein